MPYGETSDLVRDTVKMLARRPSQVDIEGLLGHLFDKFGGAEALALEYKKLYDTCKSALVRQRILMMIQGLVHACTMHAISRPADYSQWDEVDLQIALVQGARRMADAQIEEAAPDTASLPGPGPAGGWESPPPAGLLAADPRPGPAA